MVTVPRRDGRVGEAPLPGIRQAPVAPVEAFGGGQATAAVFQQAEASQQEAQKLFQVERRKAQEMRLVDLESQLAQAESQHKLDLQKVRGIDAMKASTDAVSAFDERYRQIESTVDDHEVKEALRRAYLGRRLDLDHFAQGYAERQRFEYDNTKTEEFLKVERDAAALDQTPERIELSVGRQVAALTDYARRNGLPPEWVTSRSSEVRSRTYRSIAERMLQDGAAVSEVEKFLTQRKDSISNNDRAALEQDLRQFEGLRRQELFQDTMDLIEKVLPKEPAFKVSDLISRDQWDTLTPSQRNALQERAEQVVKRREPATDDRVYYALRLQAANRDSREKFKGADLMEFRHLLSKQDFEELVKLQTGMISGDESAAREMGIVNDIVRDALKANRLGSDFARTPTSKQDAEVWEAKFRRLLDERLTSLEGFKKRKLERDEIRAEVEDLLVKRKTSKGDQFLSDLSPEERRAIEDATTRELLFKTSNPVLGINERLSIIAALNGAGIQPTESRIMELFWENVRATAPQVQIGRQSARP